MEDSQTALEAARKQIATLQDRLRAVLATNATLEQQIGDSRNLLSTSRLAQQNLEQRTAELMGQLAEQQSWQVSMTWHQLLWLHVQNRVECLLMSRLSRFK